MAAASARAALLSRSHSAALILTSAFGCRRSGSRVCSSSVLFPLRHHRLAVLFPSSCPHITGGRRSRPLSCDAARNSAETDVVGDAEAAAMVCEEDGAPPPSPPLPPPSDPVREAADALDIRVGRVLRAWRHPEADSLYVEEVDVGEAEPRTICSGLVNYVHLDHLQDARVVVLANLKPRNMRGVKSSGMLMAASDASHETVELLLPPESSVPGERIWFGSEEEDRQPEAATPNQETTSPVMQGVRLRTSMSSPDLA